MSLPDFSMRQLLEAGVHFGHQSHRWNPKMSEYIFGTRNNIHIVDLTQSVPMLHRALQAVSDTVAQGGRILFVGTKRQAQDAIAEAAKRSAQYYVNSRWLGGTLTNWKTVSNSIKRLRALEEMLSSNEAQGYTKKERLTLQRERDKLDRSLGGIKDMGGLPDLVFVIDTNKEDIAIKEARRLNVPVAAVVDTNCDPDGITYVVPGNDDASRAITLYCDLVAKAAIDGISRAQGAHGVDVGAQAEPVVEELPPETNKLGFEPLSGPRGVADDLKKLPARIAGDREEAQRPRHFPLPADRRPVADRRAQSRRRGRTSRPRRRLDRQGQGTDRRGSVRGAPADDDEYQRIHGERAPRPDRSRHDGLQGGAQRDRRQSRCRGRLAAQEGLVQGREEGRAGRRRRSHRRRRRRDQGHCGRGQFRDRFRRPQRSVPGPGEDDRRCGARRRLRRGQNPRRASRQHHRSPTPSPTPSPRSART